MLAQHDSSMKHLLSICLPVCFSICLLIAFLEIYTSHFPTFWDVPINLESAEIDGAQYWGKIHFAPYLGKNLKKVFS